jgi:hypothetical protein
VTNLKKNTDTPPPSLYNADGPKTMTVTLKPTNCMQFICSKKGRVFFEVSLIITSIAMYVKMCQSNFSLQNLIV